MIAVLRCRIEAVLHLRANQVDFIVTNIYIYTWTQYISFRLHISIEAINYCLHVFISFLFLLPFLMTLNICVHLAKCKFDSVFFSELLFSPSSG